MRTNVLTERELGGDYLSIGLARTHLRSLIFYLTLGQQLERTSAEHTWNGLAGKADLTSVARSLKYFPLYMPQA